MKFILKMCFVVLLASIMVLPGFSGGQQSGPANDVVELRILTRWSGTDSFAPILQATIDEYQRRNPSVRIINESVNDEAAYNNRFRTGMATGNMPAIFAVNGLLLMAEYAENDILLDITPYLESDSAWRNALSPALINTFDMQPYGVTGIYGVPTANAIEVLFYNKDLFRRANITVPPSTFEELVDGLKRIQDLGAIPWGVGGADTWRLGHIHNALLYKLNGVNIGPDLGINRTAKWTDQNVVRSMEMLLDLQTQGMFRDGFVALNYDTEKLGFLSGEYGVVFNGTWFIGDVVNGGVGDNVGAFLFPPLASHPQFAGHNIIFPQGVSISGRLTPEQEFHAVEFMKLFTSREIQERMVYETQNLPARIDLTLDPNRLSPLFVEINNLVPQIQYGASDSFSYDPIAAMQDRTRNSLIGMMLGNTPREAAQEIQAEIDSRQ